MTATVDEETDDEREAREIANELEAHGEVNALLKQAMLYCETAASYAMRARLFERAQAALSYRATIQAGLRAEALPDDD